MPGTDADGGAGEQTALGVLGRTRIFGGLLDVLDRDEALQAELVVHHEDFFNAVLVQQLQDFVAPRAFLDRHQFFLRRHDARHRLVVARLETQVAAGHDTDQLVALRHRHAGNMLRARQIQHLADGGVGRHGDRVADDAGLEFLDPADFLGLACRREVLVDNAEPPFLGQADRGARLGHGVHGRGQQRDIQADGARKGGFQVHVLGQDARMGRKQQDIVKGEGFLGNSHGAL